MVVTRSCERPKTHDVFLRSGVSVREVRGSRSAYGALAREGNGSLSHSARPELGVTLGAMEHQPDSFVDVRAAQNWCPRQDSNLRHTV